MSNQADMRSLDRLSQFLQELTQFRSQLLKEIEALELELRRITNWLNSDVIGYWTDEYTKAHRIFLEAERNLSRCLSYVRADEQRPCTEEKKRVQRAKMRRELCERQLKFATAATGRWENELTKNRTRVERCRDMADSDLLVAVHQLRSQLEHLESYANLKSAAISSAPSSKSTGQTSASELPDDDRPQHPSESES